MRLSAFLIAIPLLARAGTSQSSFDASLAEEALRPEIERVLSQGAASVAVAIVVADEIVWQEAYGFANAATATAASAETLYGVGSTFKAVTATAVMRLVERGDLDLDQPVATRLADLHVPWSESGVTIRHLLQHTSGLSPRDETTPVWERAPTRTLEEIAAGLESVRPAGESFEYCNAGYAVLGLLIERASGRSFQDYVVDEVLRPIGVTTPAPITPTPAMVEQLALPYVPGDDAKPRAVAQTRYDVYPAGDAYLTAGDMARFLGLHVNGGVFGGARILSEESVTAMRTPGLADYGLGWGILDGDPPLIGHGGSVPGFRSHTIGDPATRTGVFVVANSGDVVRLARAALTIAQGRPYVAPDQRAAVPVEAAALQRCAGLYELAPGHFVTVFVDDQSLELHAPDGRTLRLLPASTTTFFDRELGVEIEFPGQEGAAQTLVIREGGDARRVSGTDDRPAKVVSALVQGAVEGLTPDEAQRLYARARFLADAEPATRTEARIAALQVCEISGAMPSQWEQTAQLLAEEDDQVATLLARYGFLSAPFLEGAERVITGIEARSSHPDVRFACELARIDLIRARQRSGTQLTEEELARAIQGLSVFEETHGQRQHLFGGTVSDYCERTRFELQHLAPGQPAPELAGSDLSGAPIDLAELRGRVVLLNFWASWCRPCVLALPRENDMVRDFANRPFTLLGINADQDREAAREFAASREVTWRSVWNGPAGPQGPIATRWNILNWPTLYLIDHEGIIRQVFLIPDHEAVRQAVEELVLAAEAK